MIKESSWFTNQWWAITVVHNHHEFKIHHIIQSNWNWTIYCNMLIKWNTEIDWVALMRISVISNSMRIKLNLLKRISLKKLTSVYTILDFYEPIIINNWLVIGFKFHLINYMKFKQILTHSRDKILWSQFIDPSLNCNHILSTRNWKNRHHLI